MQYAVLVIIICIFLQCLATIFVFVFGIIHFLYEVI